MCTFSGRRRVEFANGTVKTTHADGRQSIRFSNGDFKLHSPGGRVDYFYSEVRRSPCHVMEIYPPVINMYHSNTCFNSLTLLTPPIPTYCKVSTWHTTHGSEGGGVEVFHFPGGQTEAHHPDGLKEIVFPDGRVRVVMPGGTGEREIPRSELSWAARQAMPQMDERS